MGGVAGHMDHLYDNPSLTFSKMKEIMSAGANAELDVEEKVDGQNLFLSYSVKDDESIYVPDKGGRARGARNKGNLRSGGLDARGLAQKFAGRGGLEKAFTGAFSAFEQAVESLSDDEKLQVFGPDADIWYNAEVMDPGSSLSGGEPNPNDPGAINVIKYDDKTLKIHDVGHFVFDRESGEKRPIPPGSLKTLDNAFDRMQTSLKDNDFNLARRAIIQLQKLEDRKFLEMSFSGIDKALSQEGLNDGSTVQEYTFSRLMNGIDIEVPKGLKKELVKYLLEVPGNIGKREIKRGLTPDVKKEIDEVVQLKRILLREAIHPIEMIVHDYTVEILRGLESVFIANTSDEVKRLKNELAKAVNSITAAGSEDPAAMEVMQFHLNKIKDFSQITTPIEALVFDYDGHTYKFAGNFAPLNQILGMYKYPKSGKKVTTENIDFTTQVLTEKEGKKVALLPGGFKPPHAGHYGLARQLAADSDIDEVVVIIGKNPRESEVEPKVTVTAEQSKRLWDIYTRGDENIKVRIQQGKTPVADVYDLIADKNSFSEGDTVVLGKSDKDVGDKRYARAQSWAEMNNPGVNVEEMVFPVFGGKDMGGTALRNMISASQKDKMISKLPDHITDNEKEQIWDILSPSPNNLLTQEIDRQIDEMSAMGAGAIAGNAGGFGPPNHFNAWHGNRKSSNRKVPNRKSTTKRAKRQRRR
jgi:hypothetical protein